jgi:hypothetical protein
LESLRFANYQLQILFKKRISFHVRQSRSCKSLSAIALGSSTRM